MLNKHKHPWFILLNHISNATVAKFAFSKMDENNHTVAEKNSLSIQKHCTHFDYYLELSSLMNININRELHIYSYVPTQNGTKCVGTKG